MSYKYKAKDYPLSEMQSVEVYNECFDIDNETIVFDEGLNNYKDSDFILNAQNLNRICDDANEMQANWNISVIQYLADKVEAFQEWIDRLSDIIIWQSGSEHIYKKNNIATTHPNNGAYYLCIQDCDGSKSLSNTDYWIEFYLKGNVGDEAWENLNYVGQFSWSSIAYEENDIVYVVRNTEIDFYVCKRDVSYSAEADPAEDINDWTLAFSVQRARFMIVNSMPTNFKFPYDQAFGVINGGSNLIDIVDGVHSTDISNPQYLDLKTIMQQVIVDDIQSNIKIKNIVNGYNL